MFCFLYFSLVYIISAAASPIFGFCIDKTGKNIFWVILGTTVTLGCHALLAFTFITPFVAMVSILTSIIVPDKVLISTKTLLIFLAHLSSAQDELL